MTEGTQARRHAGTKWIAIGALLMVICVVPPCAAESSGAVVTFLQEYRKLRPNDINGRIDLARWCETQELFEQQVELLLEVLKRQPDHEVAYKELLACDAKRKRPVEKEWAGKLETLLGPGYRLHHSPHFTLLSDMDAASCTLQLDALESTYATFYAETQAIGLRPMPPAGRLVCLLFGDYEKYRDYLRRFELVTTPWADGHYSWRTNRASFYHDLQNPVFKEFRETIAASENKIAELRKELDSGASTARKMVIQEQLKKLNPWVNQSNARLAHAARNATLGKTRHEAAHQLMFNSGLQKRDRDYPFWLAEGLAMVFELCDEKGNGSPRLVNTYRLMSYREVERSGQLMSVSKLLEERPGDDESAERVSDRYAQAWAFVHFLWNRRPEELVAYMRSLEKEAPGDWLAHFQSKFRDDISVIQRDFKAHVERLK